MYPALAVVPELNRLVKQRRDELAVRWIGTVDGMEQGLVERAGLTFESIAAGGLRGRNSLAAGQSLWALGRGYRQSRSLLRQFQPDVIFVTGGYVCVPVTLAAREVPVLIYLPDIEPGLAIKFLARFASRVAITTAETRKFFKPGLTVVTGYPVRAELFSSSRAEAGEKKTAARQRLGLRDDWPVLLVFGGSRGARSINQAVVAHQQALLEISQIVHVTGYLDEGRVLARRAELLPELQTRYHVSAYLHGNMVAALQAADLVVSRAGASTLGEFPAVGLPAVLVPYPYAGAHQARNAEYLAKHQAAVVIDNAELKQKLKETVIDLLTDWEKLQAMSQACRSLARPDAAARLAQEIMEVGTNGD